MSIHWLEWDADGFRIPHRTADRYPIVALGDSFTEAANVGKPWPDVLADTLDRPVRNLGFRGFGPREERQAFDRFGDAAAVDIVVIGFFEGNDLSNAVTSRGRAFQPPSEVTDRSMIPTDVSTIAERDERYPMQVELSGGSEDIAFLEGYVWANTGTVETYAESVNLDLTARSWRQIAKQAPDACIVLAYFPVKSHVYLPYLSEAGRARLIEKAELTVLNDNGEVDTSTGTPFVRGGAGSARQSARRGASACRSGRLGDARPHPPSSNPPPRTVRWSTTHMTRTGTSADMISWAKQSAMRLRMGCARHLSPSATDGLISIRLLLMCQFQVPFASCDRS
ncbi:MAG: SGNH/GDSL hydrolase family protein [Chloroflexi bacterium]|nr:SGNH/GDSL hydrolase family protein [Chloroflexota bacterium]